MYLILVMPCHAMCCLALFCLALFWIVLLCLILFCSAFNSTKLYCIVLYCIVFCCVVPLIWMSMMCWQDAMQIVQLKKEMSWKFCQCSTTEGGSIQNTRKVTMKYMQNCKWKWGEMERWKLDIQAKRKKEERKKRKEKKKVLKPHTALTDLIWFDLIWFDLIWFDENLCPTSDIIVGRSWITSLSVYLDLCGYEIMFWDDVYKILYSRCVCVCACVCGIVVYGMSCCEDFFFSCSV